MLLAWTCPALRETRGYPEPKEYQVPKGYQGDLVSLDETGSLDSKVPRETWE